jgi:hypothetical protein
MMIPKVELIVQKARLMVAKAYLPERSAPSDCPTVSVTKLTNTKINREHDHG